jgi:hypothetical protein
MQANYTLKLNHMLKKSIISMAMLGAVALALASSGGGDKKKAAVTSGVSTMKTSPGFSLRAGRSYTNVLSVKSGAQSYTVSNTLLTYRKGNTIYLLPTYRTNKPLAQKSNLNLINVKVKLKK